MPLNILSIQSHVVYGHAGNAAAVFPLQQLGCEVWPLNTVNFSNHTQYGEWTGSVFSADDITSIVDGIEARGVLASCDAVLSGYMGDVTLGGVILDAVKRVRVANPKAVYLCDPVMGDRHTGLYIPQAVADEIAGPLLEAADLATPNEFELELLAGSAIATLDDAPEAAERVRARGPRLVVCTSPALARGAETVATLAVGDDGAWLVRTPALAGTPHGAGDLFVALFLGRYLDTRDAAAALAHAVAASFGVLSASVAEGADELALIAAQDEIVAPSRRFEVERLG